MGISNTISDSSRGLSWPTGNGEAASLMRAHKWETTSLGHIGRWGARLRAAVDLALASSFPVLVLWSDELIQIYNDAYRPLMGTKHPEFWGRPAHEFWEEVWGIKKKLYAQVLEGATLAFEKEALPVTRNNHVEERHFTLCYNPLLDERNAIAGILVSCFEHVEPAQSDTSKALALCQAERHWRAKLSPHIEWTADAEGHILNLSEGSLRLSRPEREKILSEGIINASDPEDQGRMTEKWRGARLKGETFDVEHRLETASLDETLHETLDETWMRSRAFVRPGADGFPEKWYGTTEDLSRQKRIEAALHQSNKLAQVGRLASSIAHEINNPLESVTNLVFLAGHSSELAEIRDYLDAAEGELRRITSISHQTLRFHKQATEPEALTCTELISEVLSLYRGRISRSRIQVERRERAHNPVRCFGGEIRQVIANLVGNALDAMGPCSGRLLLRSREAFSWKTGRRGVVITVADTGPGFSNENAAKAFQPFFTTKGVAGTGLGLWVSQEIIAKHQGVMTLKSSQRKGPTGAVITIFLPFEAVSR